MLKLNKYFFTLVLSILLFSSLSILSYGEEYVQATVIGRDVNLRESASNESPIVGNLKLGDQVEIISTTNNWYNIKASSGLKAWIYNDLILSNDQKVDPIKRGTITASNLNVRENPTTDSKILASLSKDNQVEIIDAKDSWYLVIFNADNKGWIHGDYVDIKPNFSVGRIIGDNINIRKGPSIDEDILSSIGIDSSVYIKKFQDDWYLILTDDNKEGWIYKDYINILLEDEKYKPISRSSNRLEIKLVNSAKKLLNKPYVYGASGPSSFDCSGFTYYLFKKLNIDLPRTAAQQSTVGTLVSKSSLQMGDLVFFDTSGRVNGQITHVGIYIGNGKFIHASSGKSAKRVVISELNSGYYKTRFIRGRRVF